MSSDHKSINNSGEMPRKDWTHKLDPSIGQQRIKEALQGIGITLSSSSRSLVLIRAESVSCPKIV